MQPIIRQADQYPRDPKKLVFTPEEEATVAEVSERLRQRAESGEIAPLDAANPQSMTDALQEHIRWRKEREEEDAILSSGEYDKALNDWEHGLG